MSDTKPLPHPFALRQNFPRAIFVDIQLIERISSLFNSNEYPPDAGSCVDDCASRYQAFVIYAENTLSEIERYRRGGFMDDLAMINRDLPLRRIRIGEPQCPNVLANFEAMLFAAKGLLDVLCHRLLSYKTGVDIQGFNKDGPSAGGKVLRILNRSVSLTRVPQRDTLIKLIERHESTWIDELVAMRDVVSHAGRLDSFIGFWIVFDPQRTTPYTPEDIHDPILQTGESITHYCRRLQQAVDEFTKGFRDLLFPMAERQQYLAAVSSKVRGAEDS